MLGTVQRILVEGTSRKNVMELTGRTENNRVVYFPRDAAGESLVGQLADLRMTASHDYFLRGELVANLDTIAIAS